jgi:hypothetical protein
LYSWDAIGLAYNLRHPEASFCELIREVRQLAREEELKVKPCRSRRVAVIGAAAIGGLQRSITCAESVRRAATVAATATA